MLTRGTTYGVTRHESGRLNQCSAGEGGQGGVSQMMASDLGMRDHTASFVSHSFTHIIFSIPQDRAGQRSSYLEWSNEPSRLTWSPSEASHQQQGEEDRSDQRQRRDRGRAVDGDRRGSRRPDQR